MKQQKTIEKRILTLQNRIIKFKNDDSLDASLVKNAIKRIKKEINTLTWILK